jgi:hypothetical protein
MVGGWDGLPSSQADPDPPKPLSRSWGPHTVRSNDTSGAGYHSSYRVNVVSMLYAGFWVVPLAKRRSRPCFPFSRGSSCSVGWISSSAANLARFHTCRQHFLRGEWQDSGTAEHRSDNIRWHGPGRKGNTLPTTYNVQVCSSTHRTHHNPTHLDEITASFAHHARTSHTPRSTYCHAKETQSTSRCLDESRHIQRPLPSSTRFAVQRR